MIAARRRVDLHVYLSPSERHLAKAFLVIVPAAIVIQAIVEGHV